MRPIKLCENTIDNNDVDDFVDWFKTNPQITQGPMVYEMEKQFADWIGSKHAVMVNSGSSANMLMIYALIESNFLMNKKIVVPTLSWATTISPLIQFGLEPIICDVDLETLGCDLESLETIFKEEKPTALFMVDVLGFPNKYDEIFELCKKYGVLLIVDDCETMGSIYKDKKCGTHGFMASYSMFYSHVITAGEGGLVTTDNDYIYDALKMLREHGWTRRLDDNGKQFYKDMYKISDFKSLYTFYMPGFNVRSTEMNAMLGLSQMKKINSFCNKRYKNFELFQSLIKNEYWKPKPVGSFIVNMAYPIIHPKRDLIVKKLIENNIECRPLISGAMSSQPFIKERNIKCYDNKANIIDDFGLYIPNHPLLTEEEIKYMSETINGVINE